MHIVYIDSKKAVLSMSVINTSAKVAVASFPEESEEGGRFTRKRDDVRE